MQVYLDKSRGRTCLNLVWCIAHANTEEIYHTKFGSLQVYYLFSQMNKTPFVSLQV